MSEALWLAIAAVQSFVGMAWLALAKEAHWEQVMKQTAKSTVRLRRSLRAFGSVTILLSLVACLMADPPSMALLVWVMLLAGAVALVGLILARYERALCLLWPPGRC